MSGTVGSGATDAVAARIAVGDPARRTGGGSPESDVASRPARTANLVHRPAGRGLVAAVVGVVFVLLVLIPGYFALSESGHSPAITMMDALNPPTWAAQGSHDAQIGSRWCIGECQTIERDASSTHPVAATVDAYATALRSAGWSATTSAACTTEVAGSFTCWRLDNHEIDLWVRPSTCSIPPPPSTRTGIPDPTDTTAPKSGSCVPTSVQLKIFDHIERVTAQNKPTG